MERYRFQSTNVDHATYFPEKKRLVVLFHGDREYTYKRVPPAVWREFKKADSPGRFVLEVLARYPVSH